ncbi:MAG TPA: hypothetical protein PKD55_15195 [Bellilinea sp.]|nr:hypothetical protein [Bellilinea sp.]
MSIDQQEPSRRIKPAEAFGLSEREQLFDRVSHERFLQILSDPKTQVHALEESHNNYGEYLFVTLSRPGGKQRVFLTFYGLGFHEGRERWVYQEWYWYPSVRGAGVEHQRVPPNTARQQIDERHRECQESARQDVQTNRGRVFELLADLTDEDAATIEMEDLPHWLLDEDEDQDVR